MPYKIHDLHDLTAMMFLIFFQMFYFCFPFSSSCSTTAQTFLSFSLSHVLCFLRSSSGAMHVRLLQSVGAGSAERVRREGSAPAGRPARGGVMSGSRPHASERRRPGLRGEGRNLRVDLHKSLGSWQQAQIITSMRGTRASLQGEPPRRAASLGAIFRRKEPGREIIGDGFPQRRRAEGCRAVVRKS